LAALADRLGLAHLHDNHGGHGEAGDEHLPFGHGPIDLARDVTALKARGYGGPPTLEIFKGTADDRRARLPKLARRRRGSWAALPVGRRRRARAAGPRRACGWHGPVAVSRRNPVGRVVRPDVAVAEERRGGAAPGSDRNADVGRRPVPRPGNRPPVQGEDADRQGCPRFRTRPAPPGRGAAGMVAACAGNLLPRPSVAASPLTVVARIT